LKQKPEKENAEKGEREKPDAFRLLRRDVIVNRDFRKKRLETAQNIEHKRQNQRDRGDVPVRFQIAQKPAHDAQVIGFSDFFFFVKLFCFF
jgi:hypothetical protein